jgi:hypothetical protein
VDITPTKKFIEKMCEFFVAGSSEEEVVTTFQKAISLFNRQILSFDISLIKSLSELQSLISEKENYQSRSERNFNAQKGAEKVYEDDRFLVLYITTEEASKKYGKGTKWCISAENGNQWNNYKLKGYEFYFIFDYKTKNKTLSKIAVEIKKDSVRYDYPYLWNTTDNKKGKLIDFKELISMGVPINAFKYHVDYIEDIEFRKRYGILGSYTIDEDGGINVNGSVWMDNMGLTEIPIKFKSVSNIFNCSNNKLTTLKNAPIYVGNKFDCSYNKLEKIDVNIFINGESIFNCSYNNLTSLENSPTFVISCGGFDCCGNKLENLIGAPSYINVGGDFNCSDNRKLTSLEGAPSYVGGGFYAYNTNLENLIGAPKEVRGRFIASNYYKGEFTEEEINKVSRVLNIVYR